jgi:endonuclease/exonuclease/phosphatase (EEP) superfamily protein YafD
MPTKRNLRRVLTAGCGIAIAGAAAVGVGRYFEPTSSKAVGVIALTPWSILPAAAAVTGLAALRQWRPALIGALVVIGVGWPQVASYFPAQHSAAVPLVTVMTANTLHGKADPGALVGSIRARGVDVLAAQELTVDSIRSLRAAGLEQVLPYHHIAYQSGGTDVGIWSRYPLAEQRQLTGFSFAPVQVRVVLGDEQLTVIAFHSRAPVSSDNVAMWQSDLDRLAEVLAKPAGPTIVAGDFNATRDHRQFRDLLDVGYTDAGSDAGAGMMPTYPADRSWGPVIGIDHTLVSAGLVGIDVTSVAQPGSDHLAVVARVGR